MSTQNIIRAWKDEEYRQSLSAAERGALPRNPAGAMELTDKQSGESGFLSIFGFCLTIQQFYCR